MIPIWGEIEILGCYPDMEKDLCIPLQIEIWGDG